MIVLETERLIVRNYKAEDYKDVFEMLDDEEVLKYNCIDRKTIDEVKELCGNMMNDNNEWLIELKETNKVIGAISMNRDNLRYGVNSMTISYHLNTLFTRHGYMYEALYRLIEYYFDVVKLDYISARVLGPNDRSSKLLLKLGFVYEGTLRHAVRAYKGIIYDDNLYSVNKEDFLGAKL